VREYFGIEAWHLEEYSRVRMLHIVVTNLDVGGGLNGALLIDGIRRDPIGGQFRNLAEV